MSSCNPSPEETSTPVVVNELPEPQEPTTNAMAESKGAVDELNEVLKLLETSNG